MRLPTTVPQFTIKLLRAFVNRFLWVLAAFAGFSAFFPTVVPF
jgi:hypothetical protein